MGKSVGLKPLARYNPRQTSMRPCFDLVEGGYITAAQALSVLDQHIASRTPIGQLAVENEHMTMSHGV